MARRRLFKRLRTTDFFDTAVPTAKKSRFACDPFGFVLTTKLVINKKSERKPVSSLLPPPFQNGAAAGGRLPL